MRNLLNILEILTESTGLTGRKAGDIFRNATGDEITFSDIQLYPQGGGKFEPEELDSAIASASKGKRIDWTNNRSARTGGFAIATFTDSDGNPLYSGTYLQQVKPSVTDNYVPNQYLDYRYGGKAAEKSQAGLSPQDLLTDKIDLSIADIMNQLAKTLGTDHPLYSVAHRVAMGEGPRDGNVIEFDAPDDISFTAFRDYFCEILQPIALQRGSYTGNAGEAADKFLDDGFGSTVISFDTSKTAGLSDSIMATDSGLSVKISSKGGKGATAGAKNLADSVEELEKTEEGRNIIKKYAKEIDLLRNVVQKGMHGAPLYLGVKYKIISDSDADAVRMLKNERPINMTDLKSMNLSDTLNKLASTRSTDDPANVNLYYHLIAAIAHKAAEHVNEHTNFSGAAATILNNGALVQVYTKATQSKTKWTLREFSTVYPGDSIKGVYLSAGKTYYSTGIKGNFTFKIDKGDTKKEDKQEEKADKLPTSSDDFAKAAEKIAGGQSVAKISKKTGEVGRKKR